MAQNNYIKITVFKSPERYEDYHREYIEIPYNRPISRLFSYETESTLPEVAFGTIRLRRYKWSWHIENKLLANFGINLSPTHIINQEDFTNSNALLITLFRKVSELTYNLLKEEERGHPEHTIILDKVDIVKQEHTDRLLIDLTFYACNHRDAELGSRRFQETFYRVYQNSLDLITINTNTQVGVTVDELERSLRQMQQISMNYAFTHLDDFYRKKTKYDEKAETKAIKLLKTMLKPNEFKIYKEAGYIIVQGKSGKMYKVKKGGMIEVSKKLKKDNFYKSYRLCIEPKNYGTICPTDEVVAKIKLIQADEDMLHNIAKRFDK